MIEPGATRCGNTIAFFKVGRSEVRLCLRVSQYRGEFNSHPDIYAVDGEESHIFPFFKVGTYYFRAGDINPDRFWEHPRLQAALKSWETA